MYILEPVVEFVKIEPEIITNSSITCGASSVYNCTDTAVESTGIVTCGCGNSVKDSIPDDF